MPFIEICQWVFETIRVCLQIIFFPIYDTESLYHQSAQYHNPSYSDPDEDIDLVDDKKRNYDRVPFYRQFMRYSSSLDKGYLSTISPTTSTPQQQLQQLGNQHRPPIASPPLHDITLPRPHHTETEQARLRRGSHNNSASSATVIHPSVKASPDNRLSRKHIGNSERKPAQFDATGSTGSSSGLISHFHDHNNHRLPPLHEEEQHLQLHPTPTQQTGTKKALVQPNERTTEFGLGGIKGSRPLVTLDRLTIATQSSSASTLIDPGNQHYSLPPPPQTPSLTTATTSSPSVTMTRTPDPSLPLIAYHEITFVQTIGTGGFGQVWKGLWKGTPVAIKSLNPICQTSTVPDKVLVSFEEEVAMLARLRHPNICLLLGVCLEPSHRMIITELVSRGSLWEALRTPFLFQVYLYIN